MKSFITILLVLVSMQSITAQHAYFGRSGIISFDKTMYMKNIVRKQYIDKADASSKAYFEAMMPSIPENVVLKKSLLFYGDETLFEPQKGLAIEPAVQGQIMMFALDFDTQTLSNLKTKSYRRFNNIVGEKMIIQDTMKGMTWRLTDEYRDIAGYACRRANGLTPDSIYVVAYFANEIPVTGGPESINGLPGMILGLVVPSQHVSYFATKVEFRDQLVFDTKNLDNKKVKIVNRQGFTDMILSSMSWLNKETKDYIVELALL